MPAGKTNASTDGNAHVVVGPMSYENWRSRIAGRTAQSTFEYPLFSDAHVIGEIRGCGPYEIINAVAPQCRSGGASLPHCPGLILRADDHTDPDALLTRRGATGLGPYHGGEFQDEIAALLSLCLGVRLAAGRTTRQFTPGEDPKGRPQFFDAQRDPIPMVSADRRPVLPRTRDSHCLDQAQQLREFPRISSADAVALVRAARLYQQGLWIVEVQPELAWLLLTSAVETTAQHWRSAVVENVERMRASQYGGKLEKLLRSNGGDGLVRDVAELIAPYLGATRTFVDFLLEFLPTQMSTRPPEVSQVAWENGSLKKAFSRIYRYRSQALHGGIPFPMPMCQPPDALSGVAEERPTWLTSGGRGGVWTAKEIPMYLHVFEHIVRGALLKWWEDLPTAGDTAAS